MHGGDAWWCARCIEGTYRMHQGVREMQKGDV